MAVEQYANLAQDTLNGGISNVDLSATLIDASEFPATGTFRIRIEDELIKVTARSGNVLTLVRAQEGTTAVAHSSGSTVTQVLTATGLQAVGTVLHRTDTYANIPAAGVEGREFFPTDGISLYRDDGSLWSPWGPVFPMTAIVDASYSWVNQGSATIDITHGGAILSVPAGAGSDALRLRVKSIPAAPYTVTVAFIPLFPFPSNFNACGIALRDSGSGKIITFGLSSDSTQWATSQVLSIIKWTNATTFSAFYTPTPTVAASYAALTPYQMGPCLWLRIRDDNSNRVLSISSDGETFHQLHTVGRTDFITPDQIGFFVNQQNASYGVKINILSWTEGS
jgi:hypothetical protein